MTNIYRFQNIKHRYKKNGYFFLQIQKCFDFINRMKILFKLDFMQNYYQILIIMKNRNKIAFNTRKKNFNEKLYHLNYITFLFCFKFL
jgi:hypothetical protein